MFRKSKIKIVAAIMSVLIFLFGGTLFVIYFSSYMEVYQRNKNMIDVYVKAYWQNGNPEGQMEEPPFPARDSDAHDSHIYNLSTFYSVAFSEAGDVISIDNKAETGMSDEYLIELCQSFLKQGKEYGTKDNWIYCIEQNHNDTLIVLMNNLVLNDNVSTLFHNTVLFGSIAILLLFLPSIYLAHRIVQPLENNVQKQKQFIFDISHELKTPIAVIATNAEMIKRESGESQWLNNIKYENRQMSELVYQLLELARTENTEPKMTHLNFSRIVMGSVLPFECIAYEKKQELQIQLQENIRVLGNEEQLKNVVSLLLDNALEYSPKQKTVMVSLKSVHHTAVLSFINEGEAIPEKQRKALFERFYRGDPTRKGSREHYGLGLAIAKAIVTAHHGKISVACKHNQVIFTVLIPMCS